MAMIMTMKATNFLTSLIIKGRYGYHKNMLIVSLFDYSEGFYNREMLREKKDFYVKRKCS